MKHMCSFLFYTLLIFLTGQLLHSCQQLSSDKGDTPYFAVTEIGTIEDSEEYLAQLSDLMGQTISTKQLSGATDVTLFDYHNSYFYGIDGQSEDLLKLQWEDGKLTEISRTKLDRKTEWRRVASWFEWVDEHTLLLGSSMSGKQFVYCLIDVDHMALQKKGNLDIPLPGDTLNYGGIFATLQDSNLYVAYTIYDYWSKQAPPPVDTMYLATIDFPSMKVKHITKDSRNTFPGGYVMNFSFKAEYDGYLYFITQTGGRTREHPTVPNAIFRIKKGESRIDPDYEFVVSDKRTEEAYGLYDIGDGKALTKVIRKADIAETMDYFNKNVVSYELLDLCKKTRTPLDLPPDRHDFRKNILKVDKDVYISVYNETSKSSVIYHLDTDTRSVNKGSSIAGYVVQLFCTDNTWTKSK